ncbi:MAG: hypothetical protein LBE75_06015 [Burkholderiales bacterium]|jgi:hypothetical protein|nr:hypothetical protein [Burkholderiales bacterium]
MKINVSHNIDEVLRKFEALPARQVPFAMSLALNRTAKRVEEAWKKEINTVFDRPTPFTQRAPIMFQRATKQDLTAGVKLKDWVGGKGNAPADYLQPQIHGGGRLAKRFEYALRRIGLLWPGEFAVPASGAQLDQYGNLSRGEIARIMSFLQAFGEQGYSANMTADKRRKVSRTGVKLKRQGYGYFVPRHGADMRDRHLTRGIWKRSGLHGVDLKPVIMFVTGVNYTPRFDPIGNGQKIIKDMLPVETDRAIREALETMR